LTDDSVRSAPVKVCEIEWCGKTLRQLVQFRAPPLGFTAAGRQMVEKIEREMVETPIGAAWELACITDDTDELRRLGAIR
jgi:hypothetical protein